MAYRWISDPGHAWLEVPREEAERSGAPFSRYSYYDPVNEMLYLEEDCDAPAFLQAMGIDVNDRQIEDHIIDFDDPWSPRGMEPYEG